MSCNALNYNVFNKMNFTRTIMLKLLLGDPNTRKLKRYQPIVEEINFLEEAISVLTDEELRKRLIN